MTISSSLNAGVTGLNVNASKLATLADNIANSKTYGYKRADVEFAALALTSREGSYTAGGVRATSYRNVDSPGSLTTTTNSLDIAIGGSGFLPVVSVSSIDDAGGDVSLQLVTTGSFQPDSNGLVRTNSGLALLGWPADIDGTVPTQPRDSVTGLQPVEVQFNQTASSRTDLISFGANLPATDTQAGSAGTASTVDVEYYDNLGAPQTLSASFTPNVPATGSSNTWNLTLTDSDSGGAVVGDFTIVFDNSIAAGGSILSVTPTTGTFDATTGLATITVNGGPMEVELGIPGSGSPLTQLSGAFSPTAVTKNGSPAGRLIDVEIDENGLMSAIYDTGYSRVIYQIPLAAVANPNGLESLDNQAFGISPDSGPFYLWDAGDGPTGPTIGYAREESTTDLAGELTQMIQTQRAYSSNARVITTVDEMLQETTNIKR